VTLRRDMEGNMRSSMMPWRYWDQDFYEDYDV